MCLDLNDGTVPVSGGPENSETSIPLIYFLRFNLFTPLDVLERIPSSGLWRKRRSATTVKPRVMHPTSASCLGDGHLFHGMNV